MEAATLTTARLVLEPLRPEDADEMAPVLSDERLHEFTGGRPLSLAELRERYRRLSTGRSADGTQLWFNWIVRARGDGSAMGTVQATVLPGGGATRAFVAWVVGARWQGRGIATEAARALIAWLRSQRVRSIAAHVHPQHQASQRVAARAGLVPTEEVIDGEQVWRLPSEPGDQNS